MIKFKFTRNGKPSYGFGLSGMNIKKLKEGKPMLIDLNEMGGEGEVFIFYGSTERAMMKELKDLIGPDTEFKVDPRLVD